MSDLDLAAQGAEFWGGRIQYFAAVREDACDRIHDAMRFGQSRRDLCETRVFIRFALQRFLDLTARDQRGLDIQQLLRVEHATACRQVHSRADVMCAANADIAHCEQVACLSSFLEQALGFVKVCGGL